MAMARRPVAPLVGEGMITRRLVVRAKDVAFLKGIVEAHEGLAQVFAEGGGDLTIAAPAGRDAELDELVTDLASEFDGILPDAKASDVNAPDQEHDRRG
jgi:hypothetical protein